MKGIETHPSAEQSSVFESDGLALTYQRFGSGPRIYLAFHGYGQQGSAFKDLADSNMTVFAIDLPFHGKSTGSIGDAKVEDGIRPDELYTWLSAFLSSHSVDRFDMVGYSMGARLVLCTCERLLDRIESIHLIAPDGFVSNNSYRFATGTMLGHTLFKRLPRYYRVIHSLAWLWKSMGILDEKVYKLVVHHTLDAQRSEQLYNTWTYLRYLRPELDRLATILEMESKKINVHLGEFDAIIPKSKVLKWRFLQEDPGRAKIYERGHRLLVEEVFGQIRQDVT